MRTLKAFVFSLSLMGALSGAAIEAPAALAGDPSTDAATKFLNDAQKRLDAMQPGDTAAASEIVKLTNQAIGRLNGSSRKGTPEWNEQAKRAKEIDAAARAKAKEAPPAPGTPPAAPPAGGGATPPAGGSTGAPATPAAPADPSKLDWTGEPDVSKLSQGEQMKWGGWKKTFEDIWTRFSAEDPLALAQDTERKKAAYDREVSSAHGPFRNPGKFSGTCEPFVKRKEADFARFFEARLAEGKGKLAGETSKTDDALTRGMADADALDAEVKALKSGDKDTAAKLEARRAAIATALAGSTAKLNPMWKKTADRVEVMKERISRRAAGQADDASLAVDLSDMPFDSLDKREQDLISKWKEYFTRALKEMCAWDDVELYNGGRAVQCKGDLGRARANSVGDKGLSAAVYDYVGKKEAEYLAILDRKTKNAETILAAQEADRAAMRDKAKGLLVAVLADLPAFERDLSLPKAWTDAQLEAWAADVRKWRAKLAQFATDVTPVAAAFEHQIMRKDDPRFGDAFGSFKLQGCGREASMNDHLWWIKKTLPEKIDGAVAGAEREGNWDRTIDEAQKADPEKVYRWDTYPPAGDQNVQLEEKRNDEAVAAVTARHKFRQALAGKGPNDDAGERDKLLAELKAKRASYGAQKAKAIAEARLPKENAREPELRAIAEKCLPDGDYGAAAWDKDYKGFERLILLGAKDTERRTEWVGDTLYNDDYDHFRVATVERRGDEYLVYTYQIGFARRMTSLIHHGTKAPIGKWFVFPQRTECYRILKENLDKPPRE